MSDFDQSVSDWRNAGAGDEEARAWSEQGLSVQDWSEWHQIGLPPAIVKRMKTRRLSAQVVGEEVRRQRETVASDLRFVGAVGAAETSIINSYLAQDWTDDDALVWAREGLDASVARTWIALGLAAADVERIRAQGADLATFVRSWWAAGIPLGEVASWARAGRSPEQAAAERAKGLVPPLVKDSETGRS